MTTNDKIRTRVGVPYTELLVSPDATEPQPFSVQMFHLWRHRRPEAIKWVEGICCASLFQPPLEIFLSSTQLAHTKFT